MTGPRKHGRTSRELVRDYAIYVAIGVTLVAGVRLWVVYVPEKYWTGERWVGLVLATPVIFWGRIPFLQTLLAAATPLGCGRRTFSLAPYV